ncbi:MAG: carbon-nitrogen family hydrolase [Verrucomicrobia bacterium]|nr:carbon-nitrogen family hydrolase [Verrucomicrobiota bacterium]
MRIYAVQLDPVWEDKEANLEKVGRLLEEAAPEPGSVVILPEMFATGFSMNLNRTRERAYGNTEPALTEWARARQIYLIAGLVRNAPGGYGFNQAVCLTPKGTVLGRYVKIHLFSPGGEGQTHLPGSNVALWDLGQILAAPFICYDLRFPEVFRASVRQGAEAFIVLANWPEEREAHWETLLRARAIENQAYVIGVNRCGRDPNAAYPGRSMVVDPRGEIVADAGREEKVLAADIDPREARTWRERFPVLRDARFL